MKHRHCNQNESCLHTWQIQIDVHVHYRAASLTAVSVTIAHDAYFLFYKVKRKVATEDAVMRQRLNSIFPGKRLDLIVNFSNNFNNFNTAC